MPKVLCRLVTISALRPQMLMRKGFTSDLGFQSSTKVVRWTRLSKGKGAAHASREGLCGTRAGWIKEMTGDKSMARIGVFPGSVGQQFTGVKLILGGKLCNELRNGDPCLWS